MRKQYIMIAVLFCTSLFLLMFYYIFVRKIECNLPGPKGIPLLGSALKIRLKSLYITLYEWTSVYGEVFHFSFFGIRFVCLNSSEIIREAFAKEPNATHLSSRPPTFMGRYFFNNYEDIIFCSPSKEWTRRRKLLYQVVHAYGEGMVHIEHQMSLQIKEIIESFTKLSGIPVDPLNVVEEFVLTNVEVLVVGKRGERSKELQKLMKTINDDGNELSNPGNECIFNLFPFLRFLPLPASRLIQRLNKNIFHLMELLKTSADEDPDNTGIVHQLLKVKNESDLSGSKWFTDVTVKNLLIDLMGAAHLTTRGSLMSAILILTKRPGVQDKIKRELEENIGEREVRVSDRVNCPYLEAVILEVLRYISHTPLAVMHYTFVDCELRGYLIPRNSIIIPNLWTSHHSKIWGDPFTFRPERFIDDSGKLLPATHNIRKRLIVFGYGKRFCIGESFARSRIFMFLANLLQHFTIHEPEDCPVSDLQPTEMIPGGILQPREYKVVFHQHN